MDESVSTVHSGPAVNQTRIDFINFKYGSERMSFAVIKSWRLGGYKMKWSASQTVTTLSRSEKWLINTVDIIPKIYIFKVKMKVLELNLYLFNSLGLWTDETTNRAVQVSKFAFWLWGVFYCASGCSGVYLYHHYNEVIPATNALIVFTGGMAGSASLISFGLKLKEIKLIYATLQSLVDAGENSKLFLQEK